MWYLIIPPIIVVASVLFVLWYLSRKGADPFVAGKIAQLEDGIEQRESFFRTKKFFLRILEKTAYRFKVLSLRMHNALNDLTQVLKERRKHFQENEVKIVPRESNREVLREDVPSRETVFESSNVRNVEREEVSRENRFNAKIPSEQFSVSENTFRPTVSEKIVHPEVPYKKTSIDISREEDLISRIAVNPKDFTAYEELGDHYLGIGNMKDAKDCYRQVLKLSPVQRMAKIKIRRLEKILSQKGQ